MLVQLSVSNFILFAEATIELGPGFNVLTGETGAGKSIVVDALGVVLGGRADPSCVRHGAKEAEIEALFEVGAESRARAKLEAAGIPCDGELVIRRVVAAGGRSRAFLNGRLSTAAQVADVARSLCDIASQHESVSLVDASTHLEYLDAFARLERLRSDVASRATDLASLARERRALEDAQRTRAEREELLCHELGAIDELAPRLDEEAELAAERERLRHASRLAGATRDAAQRLTDGEPALVDELLRLLAELEPAAAIDGSLAPLSARVEAARAELADVSRDLARYAEAIEDDPARLEAVEERLFRLERLLRRHGPTTHELVAYRERAQAELTSLREGATRIEEAGAEFSKALDLAATAARELSRRRASAAADLGKAIGKELAGLGMGRAKVVVEVERAASSEGAEIVVDGARLSPTGIDRVELLIAPNAGEPPRPLRKIASGGELSRALLAIKRVLAGRQSDGARGRSAGLYVFDEVDAGVSGAIAEVIGRAIADVSRSKQVVCITHLPQIAALADTHFVVGKGERAGRTESTLRRLGDKERAAEVARMIGGVKVGVAARRAALELLGARADRPG